MTPEGRHAASKRKPRTVRTTFGRSRAQATPAPELSPKAPLDESLHAAAATSESSAGAQPQSRSASPAPEHKEMTPTAAESSPAEPPRPEEKGSQSSAAKCPPAGSPVPKPMSAPRPEERDPTAISLEAEPQCSEAKSAAKSVPECPPAGSPVPKPMSAPRPEERDPTVISLEAEPQCSEAKSAAKSVPECPPAQERVPDVPVNQNRTWSSLFTSAKLPERVNLKYEEPVYSDGMLQIRGSPEEVEEGVAYWRNSLVGHFIGRRPTFLTVQTRVQSMWKPTGSMEVLSLPSGFFIFRFGLSEDRDRILEGGPWFVQNKLLLLKAWTPDTKLEKADLTTVPIWVKIHNLPLCLWTPSFIGRIASSLGQPLYPDQQTASRTRVGYARVCIEVSSQQQLPDHFRFCFNGAQVYTINLEYDWKPTRCSHCCTFGHTLASCPKQPQVQKKAWVPVNEPRTDPPPGVSTHLVDTPSHQQPPVQAKPPQGVGTSTRDTVIDHLFDRCLV